jgi:hypothetical protein
VQRANWWPASRPWLRPCPPQIRRDAEPPALSHRHVPVNHEGGTEDGDRRYVSALRAKGGDPGGKLTCLRGLPGPERAQPANTPSG